MWVAVVTKKNAIKSQRDSGDWAAFTDLNKDEAIERALAAKEAWERRGVGPYIILVGKLDFKVTVPTAYVLERYDG